MALTDPISVTLSGTPYTLPRVETGKRDASYESADGTVIVKASHEYGKRDRHLLRIDHSKMSPNPFQTSETLRVGMSTYVVFDLPELGYTATEALAIWTGFRTMFSAGSDAILTKLLGGES